MACGSLFGGMDACSFDRGSFRASWFGFVSFPVVSSLFSARLGCAFRDPGRVDASFLCFRRWISTGEGRVDVVVVPLARSLSFRFDPLPSLSPSSSCLPRRVVGGCAFGRGFGCTFERGVSLEGPSSRLVQVDVGLLSWITSPCA
eukprot:scaffold516_cov307-Pavlova_lutheri.AAC.10